MTKKEIEEMAKKANETETKAKEPTKEIMNKPVPETKETELLKEEKAVVTKYSKIIRSELLKTENSFMRIAFSLYEIKRTESFKAVGYKNIYSFAKDEFNIARGTTSNFLSVVERFGKRDSSGNVVGEIAEDFKAFTSSKLITLLGMTDKELKEVSADMSVREIKELKKKAEKPESKEAPEKEVPEEDVTVSNVIISFSTLDEYNKNIDKIDSLILRCLKAGKKISICESNK